MAKIEAEIKIISRENIKPSSPTPLHLKNFNLSSFDLVYASNVYSDLLLFYPFLDHDHDQDQDQVQDRRVNDLKSSLSETLTLFYPLAGRFDENKPLSINCTDEGAEFVEAKVSCRLSDILNRPDAKFLSRLYANNTISAQDDRVLLVQANLFDCGGIGIGVSISHKALDGATQVKFIKGWAARARGNVGDIVTPDLYVIGSCFPGEEGLSARKWSAKRPITTAQCITRRYVFDSKSINALKAKATSVQRPSRVQVIAAHICLSMMKINSRAKSHVFAQPMNLRKKLLDPPISDDSFGNLIGLFLTQARESDAKATTLDRLVSDFTSGLRNEIEKFAKMNDVLEIRTRIREIRAEWSVFLGKEDVETIFITSICKSGLYEKSDFGWGEAIWVGHIEARMKNLVVLMDTKDGDGIEAWVTLDEHDADLLETNQDFIEFATLNPSVDLHLS